MAGEVRINEKRVAGYVWRYDAPEGSAPYVGWVTVVAHFVDGSLPLEITRFSADYLRKIIEEASDVQQQEGDGDGG